MIVVIGSPWARRTESGTGAAGMAASIGRVAAAAGALVQLVGKVGDGPAGDAVLLSLAQMNIGHVAVLRDSSVVLSAATVEADDDDGDGDVATDEATDVAAELLEADRSSGPFRASRLDSADIELALRYLPDYRVLVAADPLDDPSVAVVAGAARWSGAVLIVVVPPGSNAGGLPDDATVLEAPPSDADGAFAAIVGAYAAAIDRGATPIEAFAAASAGSGWSAVPD
ncbi:MAG: hypothetical protein NVS9B8_11960 [Candidatus Limnocylindrales bacterium]